MTENQPSASTGKPPSPTGKKSRREFLQNSGAALAALAAAPSDLQGGVHSGGSATLRVGLVGCGGRGSGAAVNALRADPDTQLVAMGDAFADQLDRSLANLQKNASIANQVVVDEAHKFVGFDAYQQVIDSCDVVLLATSPHFRPQHLKAAVDAGKHVFCEKPVATDGPGVRSVMETCRQAKEKGVTIVSGLCYRYQFAKQETIQRVHEGAIGDIVAMQTSYNTGGLWHRGRKESWSDMEWQMRNWLYFTWLSGDHIAEQHIHSLDKLAWAMKDVYPTKATASGGRIVRTDPKYGNVYDHFNTVYEWPSGVRGFSSCRQWSGAASDVSDYCFGTKGTVNIQGHKITGENAWRWRGRDDVPDDMYQNEHNAMFAALRKGENINNGEYMCNSTLMAIMARMSAYTGQTITREQALGSSEDLSPAEYSWCDMPEAQVSLPGITKFA